MPMWWDHMDGNFPWWLVIPVLGMAFGFFSMWSRHQRQRDLLRMIETYAAQGKEPPPVLMDALTKADIWHSDRNGGPFEGTGIGRGLKAGVIMLSLAAAFALIDGLDIINVHREGIRPFLIPAVILGSLGAGFILLHFLAPNRKRNLPDDRSNTP